MSFSASCIRFGPVEVKPTQKVELSPQQLRFVFRKKGSAKETVTFHANPAVFPKVIYSWHEQSSTILFRVTDEQLEPIRSEIEQPGDTSQSGKVDIRCVNVNMNKA